MEKATGIPVIRHLKKKPDCSNELVAHFGCPPEKIVMIGDRVLTDVALANSIGMKSILTRHLKEQNDNKLSALVRQSSIKYRSDRVGP